MQQKKEINVIVGANIKQARENRGLTQERLSEMMGIGVKSLSAIERGVVGISLTQMKKVCELLDISSDTLLFGAAEQRDLSDITRRLQRLTPAQYDIAESILTKLIEAYRLKD